MNVFWSGLRTIFFSGKRFEVAFTVRPFSAAAVVAASVAGSVAGSVSGAAVVGATVVGAATVVGSSVAGSVGLSPVTMSILHLAPCFVA